MPQDLTFSITTSDSNEEWGVVSNGSVDYTVALGVSVVLASASVGQVSINLPDAAGDNVNRMITVKKTDATANNVVINPDGADTIDGASSVSITTQYAAVMLISDGSNWSVL